MNKITNILNYFQYNSVIILSYFFICLGILFLNFLTKGKTEKYFCSGRNSLLSPLTYLGFITHIFGHKDWDHFSSNFITILLIGPLIEERYGSLILLKMIIICAIIIALINFIFSKKWIWGSSGILYMLIVLSSFVNLEAGKIPLTLIFIFLFYLTSEIKNLFLKNKDNVSHLGHLIGAVVGIVFGFFPNLIP